LDFIILSFLSLYRLYRFHRFINFIVLSIYQFHRSLEFAIRVSKLNQGMVCKTAPAVFSHKKNAKCEK